MNVDTTIRGAGDDPPLIDFVRLQILSHRHNDQSFQAAYRSFDAISMHLIVLVEDVDVSCHGADAYPARITLVLKNVQVCDHLIQRKYNS
jgi:hypothetical protein